MKHESEEHARFDSMTEEELRQDVINLVNSGKPFYFLQLDALGDDGRYEYRERASVNRAAIYAIAHRVEKLEADYEAEQFARDMMKAVDGKDEQG